MFAPFVMLDHQVTPAYRDFTRIPASAFTNPKLNNSIITQLVYLVKNKIIH
jgi:hypothetical protein